MEVCLLPVDALSMDSQRHPKKLLSSPELYPLRKARQETLMKYIQGKVKFGLFLRDGILVGFQMSTVTKN